MHQANMNISINMNCLTLPSPQPFLFGRRLSPLLILQPYTILFSSCPALFRTAQSYECVCGQQVSQLGVHPARED